MSLELDAENTSILLLRGQAALSGFEITNHFEDDAPDKNRIVVKAAPREVELMGISPSATPRAWRVFVDVELQTMSSTASNHDAYVAAIERAHQELKITTISQANPTVITTDKPHGFATGDQITIIGSTSTPTVNGNRTITVVTATTLTVPVNVTVAGSGGIAVPTPAVTAAASAFPGGVEIDPTDDGEKDQTDNRRTRSKRYKFVIGTVA